MNQHKSRLFCVISMYMAVLKLCSGQANTCDDNIPDIANATPNITSTPPYEVNTVIRYRCNPGFEVSKGTVFVKCVLEDNSATWILSESRCLHRSCGPPGEVTNGRRIGEDFRFGRNVTYKCNTGYEIVGFAVIFCDANGEWTRRPPSCKIISCDRPPKPQNGSVSYDSLNYKSKATYRCDNSFRFVGSSGNTTVRECLANKTWSGSVPQCEEVLCPDLPRGPGITVTDVSRDKTRHNVGKRIYFKCNNQATQVTQCNSDGKWSILPNCGGAVTTVVTTVNVTKAPPPQSSTEADGIKKPCGEAPQIEHGTVTYVESQKAQYECSGGFALKGSPVLKCLSSGKWDATPPSCEKKFPVGLVVGITFGAIALIAGGIAAGILLYKKKKSPATPNKKKASPNDAVTMEEIQRLEKNSKPVPVTVL